MADLNNKGIIAYGTQEDRDKLAFLAKNAGVSASEYMVGMIRRTYANVTGDGDEPERTDVVQS